MVSYERLNPEDVQFSSAVLSAEPRRVQEDVSVSSYLQLSVITFKTANRFGLLL